MTVIQATELREQRKPIIKAELDNGVTKAAIARKYGYSRINIQRIAEELGYKENPKVVMANRIKARGYIRLYKCKWCGGSYRFRQQHLERSNYCNKRCACADRRYEQGGPFYSDLKQSKYCCICAIELIDRRVVCDNPSCINEYKRMQQVVRWWKNREDNLRKQREYWAENGHGLRPPKPKIKVKCTDCGKVFMKYKNKIKKHNYCSKECRPKNIVRKRSKRLYSLIYLRDNGMCQICGRKVHKIYKRGDLLAGTLDHIKARANGGEHEENNIQLAHMICNSRKGSKAFWKQMELAM